MNAAALADAVKEWIGGVAVVLGALLGLHTMFGRVTEAFTRKCREELAEVQARLEMKEQENRELLIEVAELRARLEAAGKGGRRNKESPPNRRRS